MEFGVFCSKCGKEFSGYMRVPVYKDKIYCRDCIDEIQHNAPYWFWPHVPACCDVDKMELRTFQTKEELIEFLNKIPHEDEVLARSDEGHEIMTVRKDGKSWWVHGYVKSIEELNLPDWRTLADPEKLNK